MAKVHLLSGTPADDKTDYNRAPVQNLQKSARLDVCGVHSLTDDAQSADLILFAEFYGAGIHFERIRRHPLTKKYREKCFLFSSNPSVIPFLPGVYASIEKRWSSARTRSGFYLGLPKNEFTTFTPPQENLTYLFSFIGSMANAAVRRALATLTHPRSFFQNTSDDFGRLLHGKMEPLERQEYHRRYADTTKASKFVLCPRGFGTSTIRLFETMRMGRVPVILSDQWVEPAGPVWSQFTIRVPEKEFAQIPRLLEGRELEAIGMGQLAHRAWQKWFSPEVAFHRVVELCLDIRQQRRVPESIARLPVYFQYLRPCHFRQAIRTKFPRARRKISTA